MRIEPDYRTCPKCIYDPDPATHMARISFCAYHEKLYETIRTGFFLAKPLEEELNK